MEKLELKTKGTSRKRKAVSNTNSKKNTTKKSQKNSINRKNKKIPKKKIQKIKVPKKEINKIKKVKKKISKKKKVMIISVILVILIVTIISLLLTLDIFNLSNLNIEGTSKYSNQEIINSSGINIGENVFISVLKGASKNIEALPFIKEAIIKIELPSTLNIKLTERTCKFFVYDKDKNKFFKVDEEGYILEESTIEQKQSNELLTYGFIFDDEVVFGSRIKDVDLSKIEIYNSINKELEKIAIEASITKVNFENSLTTITLNDKLNVIFANDTDIKYKVSFFKSILEKIGEDSVGVIDMTKDDPVFSSF